MRIPSLLLVGSFVGLAFVSAAACSGDDAPPAGSGAGVGAAGAGGNGAAGNGGLDVEGLAPIDAPTFCKRWAVARTQHLAACYNDPHSPADSYDDTFRAGQEADCLKILPSIAAGRVTFDGKRAAACALAAEAAGAARCANGADESSQCPVALITGTVPAGGACYDDATRLYVFGADECAPGNYCRADACPGTCTPRAKIGEACNYGTCVDGAYCKDEKCAATSALGAACTSDSCAKGLACAQVIPAEGSPAPGTCKAPSRPGDACSATDPCTLGLGCLDGKCTGHVEMGQRCSDQVPCFGGFSCIDRDGKGATCGAPLTAGAACTSTAQCAVGDRCLPEGKGVCTAPPQAGEVCSALLGCAVGLVCTAGPDSRCVARAGAGQACPLRYSAGGCQPDLYCRFDQTCGPVGKEGEPCGAYEPKGCVEGLFCSRQTHTCTKPGAAGAFCRPGLPASCGPGLSCQCTVPGCAGSFSPEEHEPEDVCAALKPDGAACGRESDCASGRCTNEVCVAPEKECVQP